MNGEMDEAAGETERNEFIKKIVQIKHGQLALGV